VPVSGKLQLPLKLAAELPAPTGTPLHVGSTGTLLQITPWATPLAFWKPTVAGAVSSTREGEKQFGYSAPQVVAFDSALIEGAVSEPATAGSTATAAPSSTHTRRNAHLRSPITCNDAKPPRNLPGATVAGRV
jgi:hypothetical protein